MRVPKAQAPRMSKPRGLHIPHPGNTPIVDHMQFTDARPTLGSPSASFNPGQSAGVQPNGPTRYPPGQPRVAKNIQRNLNQTNAPY